MCPLSRPVARHCEANRACDLVPMMPIAIAEIGSATSAINASCQETANIITVTPRTSRSDWMSCETACCRAC